MAGHRRYAQCCFEKLAITEGNAVEGKRLEEKIYNVFC